MDYVFNKDHKLTPGFLKDNFYKMNYSLSHGAVDYWVILPNFVKEYSTLERDIDNLDVKLIGQYISQTDTFLDVEVFYEHLAFDVNPADWLLRKTARLKETVVAIDEFKDKSTGIYADILTYKETLGGDKFVSRITVKKNFDAQKGGANYLAVRAMCREAEYQQLADFLLHTTHHWDFKDKGTWQLGERLMPVKLTLKEELTFYTFESWRMYQVENTTENRFIMHQVANDMNKGSINIIEAPTLEAAKAQEVFDKFINRIPLTEIAAETLKDVTLLTLNPQIKQSWATQGIIKNSEENFEAYIIGYLIKTDHSGYYIESVSSGPNFENYNWEINKRQLELIIDSLNNPSFEQGHHQKKSSEVVLPKAPGGANDEKSNFKKGSIFF